MSEILIPGFKSQLDRMKSFLLGFIIFLLISFVSPFSASVFLLLYILHARHHAVVAVDVLDVVIVGAGISGINMGKKLQDIGVSRYSILGEISGKVKCEQVHNPGAGSWCWWYLVLEQVPRLQL